MIHRPDSNPRRSVGCRERRHGRRPTPSCCRRRPRSANTRFKAVSVMGGSLYRRGNLSPCSAYAHEPSPDGRSLQVCRRGHRDGGHVHGEPPGNVRGDHRVDRIGVPRPCWMSRIRSATYRSSPSRASEVPPSAASRLYRGVYPGGLRRHPHPYAARSSRKCCDILTRPRGHVKRR